jgi:hypothetical protein
MLQESFWYFLFAMRFQPSSLHGPEQLYEVLLPYLASLSPLSRGGENSIRDFTFSTNLDQQIRMGLCGDFETIQRSGTCFFRVILSTLRYCCKRVGFCLQKRKQLTYAIRLVLLLRTQSDLAKLKERVMKELAIRNEGDLDWGLEADERERGNTAQDENEHIRNQCLSRERNEVITRISFTIFTNCHFSCDIFSSIFCTPFLSIFFF